MPCDNPEYDGSEYATTNTTTEALELRDRACDNGHLHLNNRATHMRQALDKGTPACSHPSSSSDSTESHSNRTSSSFSDDTADKLNRVKHHSGLDSRQHCSQSTLKVFHPREEIEALFQEKDLNSVAVIATREHDEGKISQNSHLSDYRRGFYDCVHSLPGLDPISVNHLSTQLPRAAITPETEKNGLSSLDLRVRIPLEESLYHVTNMRDLPLNFPNNKASSQAAHSSMLYNFLRQEATRDHYSSTKSEFEHLRCKSKLYNCIEDEPYSPMSHSPLNNSWPPHVAKSTPELSSCFKKRPENLNADKDKARMVTSKSGHFADTSKTALRDSGNLCLQTSQSVATGSLDFPSRPSFVSTASSHIPSRRASMTPEEHTKTLGVKSNDNLLPPMSPEMSRLRLSSPYISRSLSPWSNCGDLINANDSMGTPIKDQVKCASDSSLYLPTMLESSFSPSPSSFNAKEDIENIECQWKRCSQVFSTQSGLAQHVNDAHVRVERPDIDFQCHWQGCPRQGKGFNARYKMLIHIRTHTNEKPHKCAVCRKCFSRLENLKIHMRSHTGEKPYACTFPGCTKAYSNSSDRFKHVRTHQEEKPYKCKMAGCHKQYTDPSSLRKHVRTHGHGTLSGQTGLHCSIGGEDSLQDFEKSSVQGNRYSADMHADLSKGIKKDADRQLKEHLDTDPHGMIDIQRNIELYSSLELKNYTQKYEVAEKFVEGSLDTLSTAGATGDCVETLPYHSFENEKEGESDFPDQQLFKSQVLSVPSIVIEDTDNYSEFKRDLSKDTTSNESVDRRKRSFAAMEEISSDKEESEDKIKIRRLSGSDNSQNLKGDFQRSCSTSLESRQNLVKTVTCPETPSMSHAKHWKKRKIQDEERLQKRKQEEEEEKIRERNEGKSHDIIKDCDPDLLYLTSKTSDRLSAEAAAIAQNRLRCPHSIQSTDSSPYTSACSPVSCKTHEDDGTTKAIQSPMLPFPSLTLSKFCYPSHSPHCCSAFTPCSHMAATNPAAAFVSSPVFYSYPDFPSSHLSLMPSRLDQCLSSATASAMFPKTPESHSHLYFPYLSTLMDISSGLDPLLHPYHPFSPMGLSSPHNTVNPATASLMCPVIGSSMTRGPP